MDELIKLVERLQDESIRREALQIPTGGHREPISQPSAIVSDSERAMVREFIARRDEHAQAFGWDRWSDANDEN